MTAMAMRHGGDLDDLLAEIGRFVPRAFGALSVVGAVSLALVFGVSVMVRDTGATRDFASLDPMLLATIKPPTNPLRSTKSARLVVKSSRLDIAAAGTITEDAIVAAYQRALAANTATPPDAPATPGLAGVTPAAPQVVATNTDVAPALPLPPEAADPTARAAAQAERLPVPEARPAFVPRDIASLSPRKPLALDATRPGPRAAPVTPAPAPEQLASLPQQAPADDAPVAPFSRRAARDGVPPSPLSLPGRGSRTAIYDISAGLVYLPSGERLEAHSGVGRMRDNPDFVKVKMLGPTPPATYALSMREATFHGVAAIRLTPVNGVAPYGREGLLAHTYMLRNRGDSNGCVVFANYDRFLKAFKTNEINYITVVPHVEDRMTGLPGSAARG